MFRLLIPLLLCPACSLAGDTTEKVKERPKNAYATQTKALVPNYSKLLRQPSLAIKGRLYREPKARLPRDAKAVGDAWIARLRARGALLGAGLAGKSPDGPVILIDNGLTETQFVSWAASKQWQIPAHIRWGFVSELNLARVSTAAKAAIRIWPASFARTGIQNEALLSGRVELRDGCFFVGSFGQAVDKLAWFHAEIGLDKDNDGYFVLRDRVSGQSLARLGEEMVWSGPPSAVVDVATKRALQAACGNHEIMIVGSPESRERFVTQHPHLGTPQPSAAPTAQ
jgi:hypothetical protein